MPRFLSWRSSSFETSSSSIGSTRGSISTSVTCAPKEAKIDANSVPTAPAPSTTRDFGIRSSSRMWSELRILLPSVGAMRSSRGTEPVAISTCRAVSVRFLPPPASTSTALGPPRRPTPLHGLDAVLLHQELDALGVLVHHAPLVGLGLEQVEPRVRALDAELGGVADVVEHLGGVEQRLGRDAAAQRAGAAELGVLLHQRHLHPELRGADRRHVAAGAAADDHQVLVERGGGSRARRRGLGRRRGAAAGWRGGRRRGCGRGLRRGRGLGGLRRRRLLARLADQRHHLIHRHLAPSGWRISSTTPAAGLGISASTLSVEISNNGWSRSTRRRP